MKPSALLATTLTLGTLTAAATPASATPQSAFRNPQSTHSPNIILIYADDLGYGDTGCYGATRLSTPNIDRLAAAGRRFTNAHATAATCTPSRYSLLTGEYAWRQPGTGILPGDASMIIRPGRETLATVLRRAGYATAIVGKWHLGLGDGAAPINWNAPINATPLDLGFDYSFIMAATADRVPCVYIEGRDVVNLDPADPITIDYKTNTRNSPTLRDTPDAPVKQRPLDRQHIDTIINGVSRIGYMHGGKTALWTDEDMARTYVEKASAYINKNKDRARTGEKPLFLYFATNDIHVPRMPDARFAGKSGLGARGDTILQLDWCVGELMKTLEAAGLADNTLVIFTSDNGPVVNDGYEDHSHALLGDHKPAGPLRGGKYQIYEGGTRMPLIAHWPGKIKPTVTDALLSQADLLATLAALANTTYDNKNAPDTQNHLPALLGETDAARATLVEQAGPRIALRDRDWKLILPMSAAKNDHTKAELYNLAADPAETQNLAAQNPEKLRALAALLDAERNAK